MLEIWRNVVGYEGLYEVSNFGRVRSLPRMTAAGMRGGKILNIEKCKNGYLRVTLCKDGKQKKFLVHRLVGMAFADMVGWVEDAKGRPFSELDINHKDKNRENNFVFVGEDGSTDFQKTNLEWCDRKYNNNYEDHSELIAKSKYKTVYQFMLDGTFVREWPSVKEVQQQTGWSQGNISACCCGYKGFKSAYGFLWSYDKDFLLLRSDNSNLTSFPN